MVLTDNLNILLGTCIGTCFFPEKAFLEGKKSINQKMKLFSSTVKGSSLCSYSCNLQT